MATKNVTENKEVKVGDKKEFNMKQVFAMWKRQSKSNTTYFTGKTEAGERLVGFYNGKKQNPKEPDVRIFLVDSEGKATKEEYCPLWVNASEKTGNMYLTGKIKEVRVVGFISKNKEDDKRPYFTVFESQSIKQDDSKVSEPVSEGSEAPF